ncbi:FAD:protein FMN transferase [Marisediminicola sp. LYQ85]|uniref:FAD:protein FMN transferase n=1 Tax=Marisediminicola sp. LYQ85 TaxID=3391062 RepID=UPI0039837B09
MTDLVSHRFDAIGTRWSIDTPLPLDASLVEAVADRVERFDRDWSRFRPDSLVARIASTAGRTILPDDAPGLLDVYRRLYAATDGAVSPLVGRTLSDWGYDEHYSLVPAPRISSVPSWDDAISWHGRSIETFRPVTLDVGAAGKGYLADILSALLSRAGVDEHTVDGSGDIVHRAPRALRVALEHPRDATKAIGIVDLSTGAIGASASNRRVWRGAHHILDAVTGRPTSAVAASWAIAATGIEADGLATALIVGDPSRLAEHFDFEWVRMLADGTIERSAGFTGQIFAHETVADRISADRAAAHEGAA